MDHVTSCDLVITREVWEWYQILIHFLCSIPRFKVYTHRPPGIHSHNPLLYLTMYISMLLMHYCLEPQSHHLNKISLLLLHLISNLPSDEQRYNTFDRCKWDGHVLFIQMRGFMPKTPGFQSRCYMCPHATKVALISLVHFLPWCSVWRSSTVAQFSCQETEAKRGIMQWDPEDERTMSLDQAGDRTALSPPNFLSHDCKRHCVLNY